MRGSLCEQPHCCGDQPQSVSLRQIHHSTREHLALMNTAALKCPLQVAKAQWTIPVSNTIGATFFEKVLDFMEDFRCFQYFYFRNNFFLLQAGVTVLPFALQAEGVKAE